jgi:hypothetical protein
MTLFSWDGGRDSHDDQKGITAIVTLCMTEEYSAYHFDTHSTLV